MYQKLETTKQLYDLKGIIKQIIAFLPKVTLCFSQADVLLNGLEQLKSHEDIEEFLAEETNIDLLNWLLIYAASWDDLAFVKILLMLPITAIKEALNKAIIYGRLEIVEILLRDARLIPDHNLAIQQAAIRNHFEIVRCLVHDLRFNPAENNKALCAALENDQYFLAYYLASFPCVQKVLTPSLEEQLNTILNPLNECKQYFSSISMDASEHLEEFSATVCFLLKDFAGSTEKKLNIAFQIAALNGLTTAVQILLNTAKIYPSMQSVALYLAASNGHVETVKYLAKEPKVKCAANNNRALRGALNKGSFLTVHYLMTLPEVKECLEQDKLLKEDIDVFIKQKVHKYMLFSSATNLNANELHAFAFKNIQELILATYSKLSI